MKVTSKQPHHPTNEIMNATVIFCCQAIGKNSAYFPSLSLCSMKGLTEKDRKKPFYYKDKGNDCLYQHDCRQDFSG